MNCQWGAIGTRDNRSRLFPRVFWPFHTVRYTLRASQALLTVHPGLATAQR